MASIPSKELAPYLPIGSFRPSWAKITPWWDNECDGDLIIGAFIHGFGKYNIIFDDTNLCIGRKLTEYIAKKTQAMTNSSAVSGNALSLQLLPRVVSEDDGGYNASSALSLSLSPKTPVLPTDIQINQNAISTTLEDGLGHQNNGGYDEEDTEMGIEQQGDPSVFETKAYNEDDDNSSEVEVEVSDPYSHKNSIAAVEIEGDRKGQSLDSFISSLKSTGNSDLASIDFFSRLDIAPNSSLSRFEFQLNNGRRCLLVVNENRKSRFMGVYPQPGSCRWSALYKYKGATGDDSMQYKFIDNADSEVAAAKIYDVEVLKQKIA